MKFTDFLNAYNEFNIYNVHDALNEQTVSGKGTIVKGQVPATFKERANFDFAGYDILDYGCGTGTAKQYVKRMSVNNERFRRAKVYNYEIADEFFVDERQEFINSTNDKKMICCSNVLNVIDDDLTEILTAIKHIALKSKTSKIIFKIYQGDRSGIGKQTREESYQRNQTTSQYLPMIKKVFTGCNVEMYRSLYIIVDMED